MNPRRRRRWRAVVVGAAAVLTAGVAAIAALGFGGYSGQPRPAARTGPAATATVTRQNLVDTKTLGGTLGFGAAVPLACAATGTVTWLPAPGVVVKRGDPLLRVDDQPVLLLYGSLPMYRDLSQGAKGADVRQLEQNLSALGYRVSTVDQEYTAATATAVKRWQRQLGLPETGTVERFRVVYTSGAVRVARQLVRLGTAAATDVLSYTGDTRLVTVIASPDEASFAAPGTAVTIGLPNGASVAGRVTEVAPTDAEGGPRNAPDPAAGNIMITVTIPDQAALGGLDGGHVDVRYVASERKDVLTVPVAALLALAEGGYGLEIVHNGRTQLVAVTVGMFAEGRVEVSGPLIDAGTVVGMPS